MNSAHNRKMFCISC